MKTIEYRFEDEQKAKWGVGPWTDEPDKKQWLDEATGLPCLIVRGPVGALCGYVGVPQGHPFFNVGYSGCNCPQELRDQDRLQSGTGLLGHHECPRLAANNCPETYCDVHGGVTFSGFCRESEDNHGICHLVEEGEDDRVWWIGFDCAHSGDHGPGLRQYLTPPLYVSLMAEDVYRDIAYVTAECASLAKQLKELASPKEPLRIEDQTHDVA